MAFIVNSGVHGFAASLGAGADSLGAGDAVVASCGTGMTFTYTTSFEPRIAGFAVDRIELTNIPPGCLGHNVSLIFLEHGRPDGSPVHAFLPLSGNTESIPIASSPNAIDANLLSGISVTVA